MPAFSKETLEWITSWLESATKGAALISAICGLLYLWFNRPLKDIASRERAAEAKEFLLLRERAADSERQLLELRQRVNDRNVSPEQRERFIKAVTASSCPIEIRVPRTDGEAMQFAQEIEEMLRAAKWPEAKVQPMPWPEPPEGLILQRRDELATKSCAEILQKAFGEIEFGLRIEIWPDVSGGKLRLLVGKKR